MTSPLSQVERIMRDNGASQEEIQLFTKLYQTYQDQKGQTIDWERIQTPDSDSILDYASLEPVGKPRAQELLRQMAICRLNGGLGTSMGCVGPKSAIEVRDQMSFLDLIVTQIKSMNKRYEVSIPLLLMNSFNTDFDTQKIIKKYDSELSIRTFLQNQLPRLRKDSQLPMSKKIHGDVIYYPPGHGDFFFAFDQSGSLDQLLEEGKKYLFLGNADNLGASVDLKILDYLDKSNTPFLMEVTAKTRADVKGGTLVKSKDQGLQLLEIAQVPKEHQEDFKSVKKFKIFNTNNIWINLEALKARLEGGGLDLDVIVNPKVINGVSVIQLETAMGSAIKAFKDSKAIQVPRDRFLPVKKTDDLLLVQSNLFEIQEGVLVRNKKREFESLPLIRLGDKFKLYHEYLQRFESIPDLLELDLLTLVGDVHFGKNITLKGQVIVVCSDGKLHLPEGSVIENKALTGRIEIAEL